MIMILHPQSEIVDLIFHDCNTIDVGYWLLLFVQILWRFAGTIPSIMQVDKFDMNVHTYTNKKCNITKLLLGSKMTY